VVFPRAQYLGQFGLISLSMIQTRGLSAPSISLHVTQSLAGLLIGSRIGQLCRGTWTGWMNELRPVV